MNEYLHNLVTILVWTARAASVITALTLVLMLPVIASAYGWRWALASVIAILLLAALCPTVLGLHL